jgi:Endonuclease/Exonuclease/phosphatase family
MKKQIYLVFISILFFFFVLLLNDFGSVINGHGMPVDGDTIGVGIVGQQVMFYNVENLFDIIDDSLTDDREFLPGTTKNWNRHKYIAKLRSIYKVLIAAGKWNPPALIGFAEIENRQVLLDLIKFTPLKELGYQIVHFDSPDERGIDCAIMYRSDQIEVSSSQALGIVFPFDTANKTRDVLYAKLLFMDDTLHFFVNHWPSRYGGAGASEIYRLHVATVLNACLDSLLNVQANANIVLCGDFNDEAQDNSIQWLLNHQNHPNYLVQLEPKLSKRVQGTLKYKGRWYVFDQFIVSSSLLESENPIRISNPEVEIPAPGFLLIDDKNGLGQKPFRTYNGPNYIGGYSDHLPILIEIIKNKPKRDAKRE